MERFVETFFRFKWVFLFVLVLVPALGTGYAFDQRQVLYLSTGTVWTDKPAYLDVGTPDWNQWNTPAQNQASNVSEFLQTNSFALDVLGQTDLRSQLSTRIETQKTLTNLRKWVAIAPVGTHLLAISYSDGQPKVAQQVVQAIIDTFNKEVLSSATAQNSVALAFYQKKLQDATTADADATAALRSYLSAHPELFQGTPTTSQTQVSQLVANASFAAQHPELVKLVQDEQADAKNVQQFQDQVNQIQFSQSSQSVGTAQSFRIMDPPTLPNQALSSRKKMALEMGIAAGAALGFIVGGVVILTLLDTTMRSAAIVEERMQLPVFVTIPLLQERRGWIRRQRISRRNIRALVALEAHLAEPIAPTQ